MADESHVESSIITRAAALVYPNGTGQPSSLLNAAPCRLFRGWPVEANLKKDLASGIGNVSVFSRNGVETNVTRYSDDPEEASRSPITLTATISDNTITIGGTVSTPQTVHVRAGTRPSIAYAVQVGDTLTSIATGIATLLSASLPGTVSNGTVITIPTADHAGLLAARVVTAGVLARELKRQDKSFQISLWSPTPELRDSLAMIVDPALSAIRFINLADGSHGWIRYEYTLSYDTAEEEGLYRRDLFYKVEYPTMMFEPGFEIGSFNVGLTGSQVDPPVSSNPQTPTVPTITRSY